MQIVLNGYVKNSSFQIFNVNPLPLLTSHINKCTFICKLLMVHAVHNNFNTHLNTL